MRNVFARLRNRRAKLFRTLRGGAGYNYLKTLHNSRARTLPHACARYQIGYLGGRAQREYPPLGGFPFARPNHAKIHPISKNNLTMVRIGANPEKRQIELAQQQPGTNTMKILSENFANVYRALGMNDAWSTLCGPIIPYFAAAYLIATVAKMVLG